ncbi:glycosyltransferase family 39 protein [Bradyrhizobium sp.]|uniref:glycosyltransferase family 39 protein n=1 Tax=Bradyrhizobium sp. TaxID=376 RepID=UPI002604033B|nr:glycosyltransferase family 39 protein [Bradyrhizobium sp.]
MADTDIVADAVSLSTAQVSLWDRLRRLAARFDPFDVAAITLLVAIAAVALWTFRDYAISNDEGVQHHYGELILNYYASGLKDRGVFHFENLYLYGGLFDIIAVSLSHLIPIDPYDLRHILCALIGVAGIGATAVTARSVAGPRAGLIATIALGVCGAWYGAMFNHTKDIPFAAAMMGATLFLIRIARYLPSPRLRDIAAFGVLAGAALGMRVLGLTLVAYTVFAIAIYLPASDDGCGQNRTRWRLAAESLLRVLPAFVLAYLIMIFAWPWAALAPLNPIRGLVAFSEFHYDIRTFFAGQTYHMADVPRLYIPVYLLIRLPLLTLAGAAIAMLLALLPFRSGSAQPIRRDITLLSFTIIFPLACQVIDHGPAYTGLRLFLFVIPPLAALAGIGLDRILTMLAARGRLVAACGLAFGSACFLWNAATLVRLHPDEYLFYNAAIGGLKGASRRYDLDYWFNSMPEAIDKLETYLRHSPPAESNWQNQVYSVAVCGERLSFEKTVKLPQLRYDFMPTWEQSDFFIAPTQMNCDNDLDGKVVATVERLGVVIATIKDRRAQTRPLSAAR